jgi:hypothetical protein
VRREAETHATAARDGRAPPGLGARRAETLGLRSPYESPDPDGSEQCFRRDAGNDLASNSSVLIEVTWTAKPNRKRLLPNPVAWAVATLASGHSRPLEGHTSWVHAVAFSLDGWHIVSGSADKTLRLYEVASGRELGRFDGDGAFCALAFALHAKGFAAGDAGGRVDLARPPSRWRHGGYFALIWVGGGPESRISKPHSPRSEAAQPKRRQRSSVTSSPPLP